MLLNRCLIHAWLMLGTCTRQMFCNGHTEKQAGPIVLPQPLMPEVMCLKVLMKPHVYTTVPYRRRPWLGSILGDLEQGPSAPHVCLSGCVMVNPKTRAKNILGKYMYTLKWWARMALLSPYVDPMKTWRIPEVRILIFLSQYSFFNHPYIHLGHFCVFDPK